MHAENVTIFNITHMYNILLQTYETTFAANITFAINLVCVRTIWFCTPHEYSTASLTRRRSACTVQK